MWKFVLVFQPWAVLYHHSEENVATWFSKMVVRATVRLAARVACLSRAPQPMLLKRLLEQGTPLSVQQLPWKCGQIAIPDVSLLCVIPSPSLTSPWNPVCCHLLVLDRPLGRCSGNSLRIQHSPATLHRLDGVGRWVYRTWSCFWHLQRSAARLARCLVHSSMADATQ